MTKNEILLLNELIQMNVKSAIRKVVREEFDRMYNKMLEEGFSNNKPKENLFEFSQGISPTPRKTQANLPKTISHMTTSNVQATPVMPSITAQEGLSISANGTLPNIDAPIPYIKKDSSIWKDLKDKIG